MSDPDQIKWKLTKGWSNGNGEIPKGFPSSPWTIHSPGIGVLYISMLDQAVPPATKWYSLNLEDRTITFENETSVEITESGRAKIHTDYDRLKALPKVMPEIGRIPWTLTHCWDSENGELPKGFPSTPWTIHFPGMDVLYISMLDQGIPPATQWYTINLEDRTLTFEESTSLEIVGPGRVKIHTDPDLMKRLKTERFQRLKKFNTLHTTAKLSSSVQEFQQVRPRSYTKFRAFQAFKIKFATRKCSRTDVQSDPLQHRQRSLTL